MAKRTHDTAAAKAKKQKIILIVGGVLLLAVAGIQGPKLMKGGGSTASPPPAATPTTTGTAATPVPVAGAVTSAGTAGVVAGVALPRAGAVKVETNQLASFTLFEVKDPFVQQVGEDTTAPGAPSGSAPVSAAPTVGSTGTGTSGSSAGSPPVTAAPPTPAPPVAYATIDFNSKAQQVQVKDTFPTPEPLFVLRSLTKKQAKISVVGGSFDGGKPVTLNLGKKVTLVNTATGVRYVLKLVYTGTQPEAITEFTPAGTGAAKATTSAAP